MKYRTKRRLYRKLHKVLDVIDMPFRDPRIPPRMLNYNMTYEDMAGFGRFKNAFTRSALESEIPFLLSLGLNGEHSILDYGCGLGPMAYGFSETMETIQYLGVDVVERPMSYLAQAYDNNPNIEFAFLPIKSDHYAVEAITSGLDANTVPHDIARIPAEDNTFNFQYSSSVFTHMTEPEIIAALREIVRTVKPDGVLVNSWFVIDDAALDACKDGTADRMFPHRENGMYYSHADNIRMSVGFTLAAIERIHEASGLGLKKVMRGAWDGLDRVSGSPNYQDWTISRLPT